MVSRSTIFIGSSKEALPVASAIKTSLSEDFAVEIWNEHLFQMGEDTLTGLLRFVNYYDFGLLVMTNDDICKSRGNKSRSPRDNVVLELGMFMGALGRRRSFPIIVPAGKSSPKLPTDLLGNTHLTLSSGHLPRPDSEKLKQEMLPLKRALYERSEEAYLDLLPSTGLAIGYFENFVLPTCLEIARLQDVKIGRKKIAIKSNNFDFTIVLPKTLSDASVAGATMFFKSQQVQQIAIPLSNRSYPTYVSSNVAGDRINIFDFPTTLRASHDAVRIALAGSFMGTTRHHASLDQKEIANFAKTLRILLQKPDAASIRDNVKIVQAN
jgi:hypothetical protein